MLILSALAVGWSGAALAQVAPPVAAAPAVPPPVAAVLPAAPERMINRPATPAGDSLTLYAEPTEASRHLRISKWRQLYVRSQVDSTWCRALYGGTQFYVRRDAVTLLPPGAPAGKAPARKNPAPKRR